LKKQGIRWSIAFEQAMRHEPVRRCFRLDLLGGLAEGQCLGLSKDVSEQYIMVPSERIKSARERDEIAGDEHRALMDQLIKGVLAIGPGFAPVDRSGAVINALAVERYVLAVAL